MAAKRQFVAAQSVGLSVRSIRAARDNLKTLDQRSRMATYDVVVVGTGGVGSAALFHLARRGARVLGIDRFTGPHDRGSSHGQTRIIRQAYFEHPDYVPLLKLAYEGWNELEQPKNSRSWKITACSRLLPRPVT